MHEEMRYLVTQLALRLIPLLVVASVVAEFVAVRRGQGRIDRWASQNHYQVQSVTRKLSAWRRQLGRGGCPFALASAGSLAQDVCNDGV
jgi:hypothetical protein